MTRTSVLRIADNETRVGINRTKRILIGRVHAVAVPWVCQRATAGEAPVPLGSAAPFAVLAGATVTSAGGNVVITYN